jgi:hypothetical protein
MLDNLYYFPRDPDQRVKLAAMPEKKRRTRLRLQTQYWRICYAKLILARRKDAKISKILHSPDS